MATRTKPRPTLTQIVGHDKMSRWAPILAGPETGAFDLPPALVNEATRVYRIDQALDQTPAPVERAEADLTAQILEAADQDNGQWPTAEEILEERRRAEVHQLLIAALHAAREQAMMKLYAMFTNEQLDKIITDYLRPAHDEVTRRARAIIADHQQSNGLTPNQVLQAPENVRSAVVEMRDLAERYARIRQAHAIITNKRIVHDVGGSFAVARNHLQVIGHKPGGYAPPQPMPGTTVLDRLVYLAATRELEPWLPLPHEQDSEWLRYYEPTLPMLHPLKGKTEVAAA